MKTKPHSRPLLASLTALGLSVACSSSQPAGTGGSGVGGSRSGGSGAAGTNGAGGATTGGTSASGGAGSGTGGGDTGGAGDAGALSGGNGGTSSVETTTICASGEENDDTTLTCPAGSVITSIDFASYGTSTGACESFVQGECQATDSKATVEAACVGKGTCTVSADNETFGGDPCAMTLKHLDLQATCTSDGSGGSSGGNAGSGGSSGGSGGSDGSGGSSGSGGSGGSGGCPNNLVGWATVNADGVNTTTGGGNAAPTTVTTFAALKAAAQDSAPRVIIVSGTIDTTEGGGSPMEVASNKTIQGANAQATIYGGLQVKNVSNVIIRNLHIHGVWPNSGPDDTLSSRGSHHIWWDHLNVWDAGDGLLDITNASDYQTVSWSKFSYTDASHGHRLASLNGSGGGDHPEDWDNLKITYHHNWWGELVDQRMPRVMYGLGHIFNNFYDAPGNSYCVGVGSYGAVLVERNYFKNVNDPHVFMYDVFCHLTARDNVYDNTTGKKDTGMGGARKVEGQDFNVVPFTDPPYDYTMDDAADVPDVVTECAGPR